MFYCFDAVPVKEGGFLDSENKQTCEEILDKYY